MNVRRMVPYAVIAIIYAAFFLAYRAVVPAIEKGYVGPRPEFRRFVQLNNEVRQLNESLREVMIRDSIMPLIPPGPGIVIVLPDGVGARTEYVRRLAQRESRPDIEVAIPIIGVPVGYAISPDIPETFSTARYYAGERPAGAPYCAVVLPYYDTHPPHNEVRGSVLGPCKVWARHGAAGPHIGNWMTKTRGVFALGETFHNVDFEYDLVRYARRFGSQFWGSFESRRCRAGDVTACERAVTAVDSANGITAGIAMTAGRWYNPRVAPADAALLADLENQFGSERFHQFWKSPEPVDKAFEAAFGVALGEWVLDWSEARYGPITIGARMKVETVLLSLVFIGLFMALAVATVRGRRI